MHRFKRAWHKQQHLRQHVYGQGLFLVGVQAALATGNMLPLAIGLAAAVVLSAPLARQLLAAEAARARND